MHPTIYDFLTLRSMNEDERYYHEIWLSRNRMFAITEAWFEGINVHRKLLEQDLDFRTLQQRVGEEASDQVVARLVEIADKKDELFRS